MNFKSIFSIGTLKKLTSSTASKDLNTFLENMPQNAGKNVLIAAGIAWAMAGGLGLITMIKTQELTTLRAEFKEAKALTPSIPKISEKNVNREQVKAFLENFSDIYPGLSVQENGGKVLITSVSTRNFGEFREALAHVYNGGADWRVSLERLCVGRECDDKGRTQLGASLIVKQVSVENPG